MPEALADPDGKLSELRLSPTFTAWEVDELVQIATDCWRFPAGPCPQPSASMVQSLPKDMGGAPLRDRPPRRSARLRGAPRPAVRSAVPASRRLSASSGPRRLVAEAAPPASWDSTYALLVAYVDQHGRIPTKGVRCGGAQLGIWASTQRCARRRGSSPLTPERAAALEAIPGWEWEVLKGWDAIYAVLGKYVAAHRRLPPSPTVYCGERIGSWVNTQRQARRGNSSARLTPARIAALEAIPGWTWDPARARWDANCAAAAEYAQLHGHPPPSNCEWRGLLVGAWVQRQRWVQAGQRPGAHSPERVAALESIEGWRW